MPNLTDADKVLRNDTGISIANRLSEIAATLDSQGGTSLAATDIADLYDNTKTYIVGDYVINNQALYRCIEDITTPEDFDSTKWRAIKIMSAVNEEIGEAILPLRWVKTASGDVAVFDTELSDRFVDIKCSINPIQNGTPWIDSNEVNKVPYIKRAVAGTATRIGNHLYDKLVGGTVAFNQKVATYSNNASTVVDNQDGTLTVTSNARVYYFGITLEATGHAVLKTTIDHKYFFYTKILSSNIENFNNFGVGNWTDGPQNSSQLTGEFAKITRSKNDTVGTYFNVTTAGTSLSTDTFTCTKPILIDLTAMFGSTIADYIYSLEQATAGAGVAFFKALFPNDYYAYNAGELMSVKATAHVMKNASNTVIGNYPLDSNLELRGIPKLVNNKLEYDGDTYESNGNVTRKYGIVDLGSLTYSIRTTATAGKSRFSAPVIDTGLPKKNASTSSYANIISTLPNVTLTDTYGNIDGITIGDADTALIFIYVDAYSGYNATQFKNAMSGVYLIYELATPTTEQASPFTNPQVCDENGTEEYTDSRAVAIPVGHETYQANICPIIGIDELNIKQSGQNTSEISKLIRLEFDDTVYLAEVSCLNGVWKLKLLGAEVDLGDLTWSYRGPQFPNIFSSTGITNYKYADTIDALCSHLQFGGMCVGVAAIENDHSVYFYYTRGSSERVVYVKDTRYSDAVSFKAAVSGVKLVYPLETPIEITLDETEQFESLIGVNNVWHDGNGPIEVQYADNLKGYVDDALELKADKADTYTKAQVNQVAEEVPKVVEYSSELPSFIDKTITGGLEELKTDIKSLLPIATASGNPCNFETGIADKLVSLKVAILATGGNGTPDNPNPIVGYSSANITRCGVNIWDETWEKGAYDSNGVKSFNDDFIRCVNPIIVKPNTTYYFKSTAGRICFYDETNTFISRSDPFYNNVFTTPLNCHYITFFATQSGDYDNSISINYPATDTTYHAYNGHTYVIAFGQTVYGGVLDVTRGKLTVTHNEVDLGNQTWTKNGLKSSHYGFLTSINDMVANPAASVKFGGLCTNYPTLKAQEVYNANLGISSWAEDAKNIMIYDPDLESGDANAFKTAMSGVKFIYELATPFDIDLTPVQIRALVGVNNVYSDTNGNTTVKFKDSIQHYIDSKIMG